MATKNSPKLTTRLKKWALPFLVGVVAMFGWAKYNIGTKVSSYAQGRF